MLKPFVFSCFALAVALQVGCSNVPDGPRTVPAEGIVTLDGDPVNGAAVVFVSANGGEYSASGPSDEDGKFSLNAVEYKTGAVPGEYMCIVTKTVEVRGEPPKRRRNDDGEAQQHAEEDAGEEGPQLGVKNELPKKYEQPSPDMTFTIPEDGITDLKIELTSK